MNEKKNGFTLAKRDKLRGAFTLAEVLIVLGAIGVIAALTLPSLISNIETKVKERQVQVFERKLNQGTEQMHAKGYLLQKYDSTRAFVDDLAKEMKIISICDSEHLRNCWSYDEVTINNDGDKYAIKDAKTGKSFKMAEGTYDDTIGIVTAGGISMILAYNKDCEPLDPDSTYKKNETSKCIVGVYDINGNRGPNKFGDDVVSFNGAGFGQAKSCLVEKNNVCISKVIDIDNIGSYSDSGEEQDFHSEAVTACGGEDKIIDVYDIAGKLEYTDLKDLCDDSSCTYKFANRGGFIINNVAEKIEISPDMWWETCSYYLCKE